jgi:hypothetical protein
MENATFPHPFRAFNKHEFVFHLLNPNSKLVETVRLDVSDRPVVGFLCNVLLFKPFKEAGKRFNSCQLRVAQGRAIFYPSQVGDMPRPLAAFVSFG